MSAVPSQIPRVQTGFHVESELGRGGMGAVFAARDARTGERLAVKRLLPTAPPQAVALFQREYHVLASLQHPRIIRVYEYGADVDGAYYTMERLEGSDLRELAPLDVRTTCQYVSDVASALALLHARRLLHRDISPRNVRTTQDGRCKLIDFGALTSFGVVDEIVGTPPGIAPECVFGQALDQRADLFSLGALAYWLLTGRQAFPARRVSDLADVWIHKPAPPSAHAPGVPRELDELVLALLSLDVLARPASAAEVIERLKSICSVEIEGEAQVARAYLAGTALVERAPELLRIQRRVQRLKTGRGGAVIVESTAGGGKSRMLAEAALSAQLSEICVLRADAAQHDAAFGTSRALLQQLARLARNVAVRVFSPHAATLGCVWPELFQELELEGGAGGGARERALALRELPEVLGECFQVAATKTLLCIAVDNVHAADAESAAVLLNLARAARKQRLLLLFTAAVLPDSEQPAALRAIREACTGIRLRELSAAGVSEMVYGTFGDVPYVKRTATRLFNATCGNPQDCMNVMQAWVSEGTARYAAGAWALPIEIELNSSLRLHDLLEKRLQSRSGLARDLADVLAVWAQPASLLVCSELARQSSEVSEVLTGLDELVRADVLMQSPLGYRFQHEAFRNARLKSLSAERAAELHSRCAEALSGAAAGDTRALMAAGQHWILAGQTTRGADCIAAAARSALNGARQKTQILVQGVPAIEAALQVYRQERRSNHELLELLVALVACSYDVSYEFALRYGAETVARLEQALGLPSSAGEIPELTADELMQRLAAAPVVEQGYAPRERAPDVVVLVGWLTRSVLTLVAATSAAIDHRAQARFSRALRPFLLFGPHHPSATAYEFCRLMVMMTQDRLQANHAGWCELLARLPELGLPQAIVRPLEIGAITSLGLLESQRDDDAVLLRLEKLEQMSFAQRVATVNQLRFLYHGFRGEVDLAEQYRARVEEYAIGRGAAWQVEIWSMCTLTAVYGNTQDATRHQRVLQELERLKRNMPSLEPYWQRARAAQCLITGDWANAARLFEEALSEPDARERVGWGSARGALARAYNQLGEHEKALATCLETIAVVNADREFVAMNLTVQLELCVAYAGLGQYAEANAALGELSERHAASTNPMTRGTIHRTFAQVALREKDWKRFEQHLERMEYWFTKTENPALIAQCAKLRNASMRQHSVLPAAQDDGSERTNHSIWRSLLSNCRGSFERQQRALELVARQVAATQAWLVCLGPAAEPVVKAQLGTGIAPPELLQEVADLVDEFMAPAQETCFTTNTGTVGSETAVASAYRLFPLTVIRGTAVHIAGAIAVQSTSDAWMNPGALQDLGLELYESGDIGSIYELG
ncbi:MAG TPA: protein kinase [Polyangiales bacterium]|nr:protein kinase [Polyangiales bacterium]